MDRRLAVEYAEAKSENKVRGEPGMESGQLKQSQMLRSSAHRAGGGSVRVQESFRKCSGIARWRQVLRYVGIVDVENGTGTVELRRCARGAVDLAGTPREGKKGERLRKTG